MACCLFPDVMSEAQRQLDAVVGKSRLPGFSNKGALPYIDAILQETMRWRSIGPLGMPHASESADVYNGYHILAKALVIPLYHAINMDSATYADPTEFAPERWLHNDSLEPPTAFGYGPRMCTGRHIARNSLWAAIARVLWAFDLKRPIGPTSGEEIELDPDATTTGFAVSPLPFKAIFQLKGPWVSEVVNTAWQNAATDIDEILKRIGKLGL